jgi:ABC-type phosphate/phosphonate transport system substrate-binding protein
VRVRVLLAFLIVTVAVGVAPEAPRAEAGDPAPRLKIGLSENLFSGVPPAVVQPAAAPFRDMFERQTGLKGEVEVTKDYAEITDKLRGGKLEVGVYHGFEYAWVKQHPQLVPLVVTTPSYALKACLVVHTESKAQEPGNLKGECVAIPATTKAYCRLYLERLKADLPEGCCGPSKHGGKSVEEALDALVAGSCEAVLVDGAGLKAYQNNKPGVGKQLKVLAESEPFPPALVVYRKGAFNETTADKLREGLVKGMNTPQGRLLSGLWRLKGFEKDSPQYQTELDRCLKAYPPPKEK